MLKMSLNYVFVNTNIIKSLGAGLLIRYFVQLFTEGSDAAKTEAEETHKKPIY